MEVALGQAARIWPQIDVKGGNGHAPRLAELRQSPTRTRFVLVDPHTLSREGLSRLLTDSIDGAQIDECDCVKSLSDRVDLRDAIAILVVGRAGQKSFKETLSELDGSALMRTVAAVILLSDRWEMASVKQALALGVRGCVSLSENFRVVAAALRLVTEGGVYVPPECLGMETASSPASKPLGSPLAPRNRDCAAFTPQEQKVLAALLEGKSNKRIARDLELCESTVKVHVRHIMRKMSVSNRTQVALWMMRDDAGRPRQGYPLDQVST